MVMSMSHTLFLVLVFVSTLRIAPHEYKDSGNSQWTTALLPDAGSHSLVSRVNDHTHFSLLFLDPLTVEALTIGGSYVLFQLGIIAWAIVTWVWYIQQLS